MNKIIYFLIILSVCKFVKPKLCKDVDIRNTLDQFDHLKNCTTVIGYLKIMLMDHTKDSDFANLTFPNLTEVKGFLMVYRMFGIRTLENLLPNLVVIRGQDLFFDQSLIIFGCPDLEDIGLHNLRKIENGSIKIGSCPKLCYLQSIDWNKIAHPKYELQVERENCSSICPKGCLNCWNKNYCQKFDDKCHEECIGCTGPKDDQCLACETYRDGNRCVSSCTEGKVLHSYVPICVTEEECKTFIYGEWTVFDKRCVKMCNGTSLESSDLYDIVEGCVYNVGDLLIRESDKLSTLKLNSKLKTLEVVEGYVKIYRSPWITNLDFLKNLKVIYGNKLYNRNFSLVVWENRNLHRLWNWDNFSLVLGNHSILFHYNPQLCPKEIEKLAELTKVNFTEFDVSYHTNGAKRACFYVDLNVIVKTEATNATLKWDNFTVDNETYVIGYVIYYNQDPTSSLTISDERSECDENSWDSVFVTNTSHFIPDLNAYTQYAYYIKVYTTSSTKGGLTQIGRFKTNSSDPELPLDSVSATAIDSSSIKLSWLTPIFPSGVITHHNVAIYCVEDNETFVQQRDYCKQPFEEETCPCETNKEIVEEEETDSNEVFTYLSERALKGITKIKFSIEERRKRRKRDVSFESQFLTDLKIPSANTSYVVENLKHFTTYVFLLSACVDGDQCSSPIMAYDRTKKKKNADTVVEISASASENCVTIHWVQPTNSNSLILAYHVEVEKVDFELKTIKKCLTKQKYVASGSKLTLKNLTVGWYRAKVQTISLAGLGCFSKYVPFEVIQPNEMSIELITVLIVFVITLTFVGICYYRYYNQNRIINVERHNLISDFYWDNLDEEFEINRKEVELYSELVRGTYGVVFAGKIKSNNLLCAVKMPGKSSTPSSDKLDFLNEHLSKSFSNCKHVVKLLGYVSQGTPPMIIYELMTRGNLKAYLKDVRSSSLGSSEMYRMAAEIADGMMFLASKKIIHKDLAARNCMVTTDKTVKIGDFGLSHELYPCDYYKKGTSDLLPIRWMSPESLADGVFTTDTDVWSYGVLLWEIVTLAQQPYGGLSNEQVIQYVISQGSLDRPIYCPNLLFEIMSGCWSWKPYHRPMFCDIVEKLEQYVGQNFWLVSFYHSSESEECKLNRSRIYNAPAFVAPFSINTAVYWDTSYDDVKI